MDSDEDEIFEQSIFDDESINKGDLVWAPLVLEDQQVMWPAKVTSLKSGDQATVKMLGRQMRALTVQGCQPFVQNSDYEALGKSLEHWSEAITLAKEILDNETNGIIQTKLNCVPSSSSSMENGTRGSSKRRKLSGPENRTGYVEGDVVWAKYRSHPVWPAKITHVEKLSVMVQYLECNEVSLRTSLKNVSHFDCSKYVSNVEAGINSSLSAQFKAAYKTAYVDFKALNPDVKLSLTPFQLNANGNHTPAEPVSPHKGKNQLVHFINKNEEMFQKIIQGRIIGHYHRDFKNNSSGILTDGTLFGSFAKTELEEERIIEAIGQMQARFAKRHKLPQAYGLSVMLPEAIIRLIMFKQQLTYAKAKDIYQADVLKVKKRDRLKVRKDLLTTTVSQESKDEFEELSRLKTLKSLQSQRGKGKRKRQK